jgi:ubiquinone/menaquinone biosynthesis C-methylase UbiE
VNPSQIAASADNTVMMSTAQNDAGSDATGLAKVRLQCPCCRTNVDELYCKFCGFQMQTTHGIVRALSPERANYYEYFTKDYERIRIAEGRSSNSPDFYLNLPYKDITGKNDSQWKIRARSYDYLIRKILKPNLQSDNEMILDLGAGNCWMSYRLSLLRYRPIAVDLLTNSSDGLGVATQYQKYLSEIFPRFQAEAARLPFQSEQFDAAVFNASFHYAEDYAETLRETFRCLKRGGIVAIIDTPWYSCEESGRRMVSERHAAFLHRYGTASDSIRSLEYLTDERLQVLEDELSIKWTVHFPNYGMKWAMRPFIAALRRKREPSQFRIYVARKKD